MMFPYNYPRDRAEGGAGGALAPPLFCKNKNKLNKKIFLHAFFFSHWKKFLATEIKKAAIFLLPSRQLDMLLHPLRSAPVPLQCFPPYAGSGLVHSLFLVCIPPTALVQLLQEFHSLQPPSTTNNVVNKNIWKTTIDDMFGSFIKIK